MDPKADIPATVHGAFAAAARRWPDRPLFCVTPGTAEAYGIASREITYRSAQRDVATLHDRYRQAGLRPGHRVQVLLENRPAFFLHWLALNALGASIVPVNPYLRATELAYLAVDAAPALAISTPDRAGDLAQAAGHAVPVTGPDDPFPQIDTPPVFDPVSGEAALLYTSGTTGAPKGCVLGQDYFLEAGRWYATVGGACALTETGERMLTPLPVFHMNAMAYSFMAMVTVGGCLIALDRFHPRRWWAELAESRATCFHYLGVMPTILVGLPEGPEDRAHTARFGFGAGIDPSLQAAFEQRFGAVTVEAWAMTETGAGAVTAANQEPRPVGQASIGRPANDLDVRLVDANETDVPPGAPGALLVRRKGANPRRGFFLAYWNQPEATAEAWRGGWFHTGDIVRQLPSGDLVFVDRRKNVIRRSGENIAAVEVESMLLRHPAISAAGVAAVPDPVRGDEVCACL
ncbi:MAG: AMP-binding protein, partial [Pseudomonadota bacterium]